MAELRRVARAEMSPTQCALCLSHEGPFIDTGAEFLGYGHVYICASNDNRSGCVRQMGRLDEMMDRDVVGEAMIQIDALQARTQELERELAESKVVPLSDVIEYVRSTIQAAEAPAGKEA